MNQTLPGVLSLSLKARFKMTKFDFTQSEAFTS